MKMGIGCVLRLDRGLEPSLLLKWSSPNSHSRFGDDHPDAVSLASEEGGAYRFMRRR